MFKALGLLLSLTISVSAFSADRNYTPGDGTLDFTCKVEDDIKPYSIFEFQFMYDAHSNKSGFDLISDENFKSGNGDLVYKIDVTQFPFIDAEIPSQKIPLPGCQTSRVIGEMKGDSMEIYFECNADGDAGFGTLNINEVFEVTGKITFPEGQWKLPYPISEDTTYELNCLPSHF